MQALLRACEPEASYDFHVHDLPSEPERNVRLWEDVSGKLVAMAAFYRPAHLLFVLRPQTDDEAAAEIITWAKQRALADAEPGEEPVKLWSQVRAEDSNRVALLEKNEFRPEEGYSLRMERLLDQSVSHPHLPSGFTVRHFQGRQDAEAWADLWNDTGPGRSMSAAECLSWRDSPDGVPELDLTAVAPDGALAAYCMCSISECENRHTGRRDGWTDPIGTRPGFRRLGLARALVLTALHGLKARGCERALLGVDGANLLAVRLYESCGYRTLYKKLYYSRLAD